MTHGSDILAGSLLFVCLLASGSLFIGATERDARLVTFYRQVFVIAMLLRFAASVAIYVFGLVRLLGDEDALAWEGSAAIYADWESRGLGLAALPAIWADAFRHPMTILGYQYVMATLFFVTGGASRLVAAALNNFFGAMTAVLAARVGSSLFSVRVGSRVGWCACLFPSLVVWSAQTLKEPSVIFLETVALYACIRLQGRRAGLRHVLACGAAILLLVALRFYAAYVTAAVVFLTLALPRVRSRRTRLGAAVAVAALVIPVLILTGAMARHETAIDSLNLHRLQEFRDWSARYAGSGVPLAYSLSTPIGLILSVSVGAAHLVFAPFPWELGGASARMLLTLPELLVWWWLIVVGVAPGLGFAVRRKFSEIQPLVYFILGMGAVYSLTFSNVGLVYRQRAQLLPWLLVFAMVGLEQRAIRAAARRVPIAFRAARGRVSGSAPRGVPAVDSPVLPPAATRTALR